VEVPARAVSGEGERVERASPRRPRRGVNVDLPVALPDESRPLAEVSARARSTRVQARARSWRCHASRARGSSRPGTSSRSRHSSHRADRRASRFRARVQRLDAAHAPVPAANRRDVRLWPVRPPPARRFKPRSRRPLMGGSTTRDARARRGARRRRAWRPPGRRVARRRSPRATRPSPRRSTAGECRTSRWARTRSYRSTRRRWRTPAR
jgi:hypothetical protein